MESYLMPTDDYIYEHKTSTNWAMEESHFHDGYEVYLSASDGIQFFVNNKVYPANRGDMLIFNNMDLHRALIPPNIPYERYYLILNPKFIESLSTAQTDLLRCFSKNRAASCVHLEEKDYLRAVALFENCGASAQSPEAYGSDLRKRISLAELLLFVNNCFFSEAESAHSIHTSLSARAREIQKYIASNPGGDLSLDALAARFFISKRHMEFIFKNYCGFSVGEYITGVRVIKARELLKSGLSVTETGEAVGYFNPSHFCRVFKKHTGISPKQYALKGD